MTMLSESDVNLLEAYLDDALSPSEVQHVDARVHEDSEVAAALDKVPDPGGGPARDQQPAFGRVGEPVCVDAARVVAEDEHGRLRRVAACRA